MKILKNEPMSRHTTFRVGGPCDALIEVESEDEILKSVKYLKENDIPYYIIGNGSNLLVRDEGISGVVVEISSGLSKIKRIDENTFEAGAGIKLSRLAAYALENELTGLEFASGIPGTLGGAVFMNAGAYNGEISQVVENTRYYDVFKEKIVILEQNEHNFGYRSSIFQKNSGIILGNRIKLKKGNRELIRSRMEELALKRRTVQPLEYPSAGSTFKRPEGYFAGKLIEEAGLRGYKIGGAQVSEKHCGFIINRGDASAADILGLIEYVKLKVYENSGVLLEEEVRIL